MPREQLYKLVVMGSGSVGKSALTIQLISHRFVCTASLYMTRLLKIVTELKWKLTEQSLCLIFWIQPAKTNTPVSMRDRYMMEGHGFLMVFAINAAQSFEDIPILRKRLYKMKDKDLSEPIPMVLAGNKSDMDNERQVSSADATALAQEWQCKYIETSAMKRINVELAFFEVVRKIRALGGPEKKPSSGKCVLL
ncbi:ras protein let-60 [Pelomyxa schiedti]|nr:ras protein let-60 [Pelomyxa schiedti]